MIIHNRPMEWYLEKLRNDEYFSMGMYGDGEWQAIFNVNRVAGRYFDKNCEGTKYTHDLSRAMIESLKYKADNFYFSTANTFKIHPEYLKYEGWIDTTLQQLGVNIEFVEKNMWNEEMKAGRLGPLIKVLRSKNLCIISNKAIRGLDFLKYDKFIEIGYPNCYIDGSLERAYEQAVQYGKTGVYLIAAGIPATLLAQRLHKKMPSAFIIDTGSIWDGFVGIGGQRSFRANLYDNPEQYKEWIQKNLSSIT